MESTESFARFTGCERRIQKRRGNSALPQRIDLILHQRHYWRNHKGHAIAQQRRQLKTERLSATGRQERKDIAARQRINNDFLLQRPKFIVAEILFKRLL